MVIKDIIQAGNPLLRKRAKLVKNVLSKETQQVIADLIDTMRSSQLIGIAAPQIGKSLRIFVSEIKTTKHRAGLKEGALTVYINPEIIKTFGKKVTGYEGCGSVAYSKFFGPVKRPEWVLIEAHDKRGKKFESKVSGLLARVIQHEYDHLEGILFTDKLTDWTKVMSSEEYIKMRSKKN